MDRPRIVEYDPAWDDRFVAIEQQIRAEIEDGDVTVHHVGSTSVPGCAAKDRVDVLVEVPVGTDRPSVVDPLVSAGFEHRPELGLFLPERWFLRRDDAECNIHVEQSGRAGAVRDPRLVFRDALRSNEALRDEYVDLKRQLSQTHSDVDDYAEAKTSFVFGLLGAAAERGDRCGVHIRAEAPGGEAARSLLTDYVAFLEAHAPHHLHVGADTAHHGADYTPPAGIFLVAWDNATAVGCGAVRELEPGVAEFKRMWVADSHRGRGLGARMLGALETAAGIMNCATVRLDSMRTLESAISMYRRHGYTEVEPYNSNPDATIWLQHQL